MERRVFRAAEAALADHQYVSAIDIFCGMDLLSPADLIAWRTGKVPFLERVIQSNLKRNTLVMSIFHRWAAAKGLLPRETAYMRKGRSHRVSLQFSKSGDPGIEKRYRLHFISPALRERKRAQAVTSSPTPPAPSAPKEPAADRTAD